MHSWLSSPISATQREVEKRRYSRIRCYSEGKKRSKVVYLENSDPTNYILWKVEEMGLTASAEHTSNSQSALGTKLNSQIAPQQLRSTNFF